MSGRVGAARGWSCGGQLRGPGRVTCGARGTLRSAQVGTPTRPGRGRAWTRRGCGGWDRGRSCGGGSWLRRRMAAAAPQVLRAGISRGSPDPPLFEGSGTARARLRRDVHGHIWEAGSPNMAGPAGRTRSDVKPPIRQRLAPPSCTLGPGPAPASQVPRLRGSLELELPPGPPGPAPLRSSRVAPAPPSALFPPPSSLLPEPETAGPYRATPNKALPK